MSNISLFYYGRKTVDKNWRIESNIGINRLYYIHRTNLKVILKGNEYALKENYIYIFPQNIRFEPVITDDLYLDHTFFDFATAPAFYLDSIVKIDLSEDRYIKTAADAALTFAGDFPTYETSDHKELYDVVKAYFCNLLFLIQKKYNLKTISDERINKAVDYIHKNICSEITIEKLAALSYMEKNYFIRFFKKYIGSTPHRYIKMYRINLAFSMILQGHSISDAAAYVGYSTVSAFSNAVKKEYGIYPLQLIKNKQFSGKARTLF